MRVHGDVAIGQRIYLRAQKTPPTPSLEQLKPTPPDEAQKSYAMAM